MKFNWNLILMTLLIICPQSWAQTTIDLNDTWLFLPDEQNIGLKENWYLPNINDSHWKLLIAGKRWEDQGFPELEDYAWFRKEIKIPSTWEGKKIWLLFGGVNDSYILFCNGMRINSFGDQANLSVAAKPTVSEISRHLKYGELNTIALRVYDWGGSGGLWRLPVKLTTDINDLEIVPMLSCYVLYERNELWVENDLSCLGNEIKNGIVYLEVRENPSTSLIARREQRLDIESKKPLIKIALPQEKGKGTYQVKVVVLKDDGNELIAMTKQVEWPSISTRTPESGQFRDLNNFVSELLNTRIPAGNIKDLKFINPRTGWMFFSLSANEGMIEEPSLYLNKSSSPIVLRLNPDSEAKEAMLYLSKGTHRLSINNTSECQLIVRTIPEIIYSDHPSSPHITPYGKYDWSYLKQHVLSHVNTIVTSGSSLAKEEAEQWVKEGRKWIVHAGLPGLNRSEAPSVKEVFDVWMKNPGVVNPIFNGIIVDEFLIAGKDHYNSWTEAVNRLYKHPKFSGKVFYAYCGDIFSLETAAAVPFGQNLIELGGRIALERYLPEQPTEEQAMGLLLNRLQYTYNTFRKNVPSGENHLVIVLGYLSDATESLNRDPSVDYKTFVDMQFHLLATDPTFKDLYGIQEYLSSYADEEILRWAHQLFRHYCIDGKRTRFSNDPYLLPHLINPDFAQGVADWHIFPAEQGSIQAKKMPGYSWLHGRYPSTSQGDQFVWFKRSAEGPNSIKQQIRELDPSRLYSLKMISADLKNLDKKQKLAISIRLKDVDLIKDYCFQFVYPSNYAHELGPYNRNHPAWMNYHRIVFRPMNTTADLIISDWLSPADPGGPVGQELIFNFIEIQPFYE